MKENNGCEVNRPGEGCVCPCTQLKLRGVKKWKTCLFGQKCLGKIF